MFRFSYINNTFESYQQLIRFYELNSRNVFSEIPIALEGFFAANMSAALGAILDQAGKNFNLIQFANMNHRIRDILERNEFLSY